MTDLTNSWAGHFGFSYDDLSRRTQLAKPNGISTNYAYDSVSRLLSVLHQAGTTTVDGASYTNDNAGNRTAKQNLLTGVTENYSYDPIYQLTQVLQGANTTEAYTYDDVGNRLSDVSSSGWQYNSSNQLTSTPSVTNTFDQNGNTLTKADSSGTTQYSWDIENRLTSVTLPGGGGTVSFKYDPFGRRIQKTTSSGTTNYVYDGANFIAEYDTAGALLAKYAQGAGIDEPLAISRGGQVGYYDADGLGSITSVIDNTLTPLATYTYDAFGKRVTTGGSLMNPFQYTGREWDQETGLYYYRARYYDPRIGRFITEDPIGYLGGSNFYSYALNSPTDFSDPTGLQSTGNPGPAIAQWLTNFFVPLPSGGFIFYGNWGGPGWTGGQTKPYEDLTPEEQAQLAPPIDDQDACYMQHDICYSRSRVRNHCTDKDNPNEMQTHSDDIESASCDAYLAQCLSKLHSSNSHSNAAIPVFKIKAYGKILLFSDPDMRPSWLMDISGKIGGNK